MTIDLIWQFNRLIFCHITSCTRQNTKIQTNGHKLVKEIGKKVMEATGERQSSTYLLQAISIAIQRGNSSCVFGTVPQSEGLEEIFEFVSAST